MILQVDQIKRGTIIFSRALILKCAKSAIIWNDAPFPFKSFLVLQKLAQNEEVLLLKCAEIENLIISLSDQSIEIIDVCY